MFYIWISMQCYFAFLSIDMFVFFTRYSFEIFVSEVRYVIHQNCCYCAKYMTFAFAQKLSARTSKADKGHRSLSEAIRL